MRYNTVADVRNEFRELWVKQRFTNVNREASMTSVMGNRTIELMSVTFIADEPTIFGAVDRDYVRRESQWYASMSRNVNDIPGGAPEIWKRIASPDGTINSNYGYAVWSDENHRQFDHVVSELCMNPESRRAVMIYTRPSMWLEYNENGRNDFMCTNVVQYLIRDGAVHSVVQMRSNDAIFGFKNDREWQSEVLHRVSSELSLPVGNIYWNVGSLHVYERHFYLVDHFDKTSGREINVSKSVYRTLYPNNRLAGV